MKKILFYLFIMLFFIQLTSCNSEDSGSTSSEPALAMSNVVLTSPSIDKTSVSIKYTGSISGSNRKIIYRIKGSNANYQSVNFDTNPTIVSGLYSGVTYEFRIEVSNSKSNLQSDPIYRVTHAVDIDYDELFTYNGASIVKTFAAIGQDNYIIAPGINNFSKVNVYLINEARTDSIMIPSKVVADSLKFTIPYDYLTQDPRESVKNAYVGIKVNDDYQHIADYTSIINNAERGDVRPLIYEIYNTQPYLTSITEIQKDADLGSNCPTGHVFKLIGEFYEDPNDAIRNNHNWLPTEIYVEIYYEDGRFFRNISNLNTYSDVCTQFNMESYRTDNRNLHPAKTIWVNLPIEPGKYKVYVLFVFNKPDRIITTNTLEFEAN